MKFTLSAKLFIAALVALSFATLAGLAIVI